MFLTWSYIPRNLESENDVHKRWIFLPKSTEETLPLGVKNLSHRRNQSYIISCNTFQIYYDSKTTNYVRSTLPQSCHDFAQKISQINKTNLSIQPPFCTK